MKYSIDMPKIYQCEQCHAILEKERIGTIKTDEIVITYCSVCGYDKFKPIDMKG